MKKYKLANEEGTAVNIPGQGVYHIHPGVYLWQEYQEWLAQGNTPEPFMTNEDILQEAKAIKFAEIESSYLSLVKEPVVVNGKVMKGGESSANTIAGQLTRIGVKKKKYSSITDVRLHDAMYKEFTVPISEAEDIAVAVADKVEELLFRKVSAVDKIISAATIQEVEAVKF